MGKWNWLATVLHLFLTFFLDLHLLYNIYSVSASYSSGALDSLLSCDAPDLYVTTQAPYLRPLQKLALLWEETNFLGAIETYRCPWKGTYAHDWLEKRW